MAICKVDLEPGIHLIEARGRNASNNGATKINQRLREMFHKAICGEKDGRIKDLDTLIGTCQSLHVVCEPEDGYTVLECSGNTAMYTCLGCKSFKGVGICSHVLAINHILKNFNVRYELK